MRRSRTVSRRGPLLDAERDALLLAATKSLFLASAVLLVAIFLSKYDSIISYFCSLFSGCLLTTSSLCARGSRVSAPQNPR